MCVPKFLSLSLSRADSLARASTRLLALTFVSLGVGVFFLVILLTSIIRSGVPAFTQTIIEVPVYLNEEVLDPNGNRDPADLTKVSTFGYAPLIDQAIFEQVSALGLTTDFEDASDMRKMLSDSAMFKVL